MSLHNPSHLLLIACLAVATTAGAEAANPYARPKAAPTAVASAKGSPVDDLSSLATGGTKVLESIKGDLTGAGQSDVLVILDPPSRGANDARGPFREVVLLVRDEAGQLRKAATNARIVPCAVCGGASGDPYAYSHVDKGQFTIVIGGGGRERWSDEYTFAYVTEKEDWYVSAVLRKVFDTVTDEEKHRELTPRELGTVSFTDFDPGHLPDVSLP